MARARRFTASSSAALLAVAGLGALDKISLAPGSDVREEPISSEFAAITDDLITEQAADREVRADVLLLQRRHADRDGVDRALASRTCRTALGAAGRGR